MVTGIWQARAQRDQITGLERVPRVQVQGPMGREGSRGVEKKILGRPSPLALSGASRALAPAQ